jgi:hypothetical protein
LKENHAKAKAAEIKPKNVPNNVQQVSTVITTPHGTSIHYGISGDTTMGYELVYPPVAQINFDADAIMADDLNIEISPLPAAKMKPMDAHHLRMVWPKIDQAINLKAEHLY